MKTKKINLAKAINNKNCLGFVFRFKNGRWYYQNDNDLGLDLEGIDFEQPLVKKIYVYKRFYVYQVRGGYEDTEIEKGVTFGTMLALAKECHHHFIPLTEREEKTLKLYWGF